MKYFYKRVLHLLENGIAKYSNLGSLLIMGVTPEQVSM